uniref:G-protein coupled receptors family 3 profile domain-containing protein n=1 Tax=Eptatretus burgeri TaxID=7764 RepID=A0A8C4N7M7_EPTBU
MGRIFGIILDQLLHLTPSFVVPGLQITLLLNIYLFTLHCIHCSRQWDVKMSIDMLNFIDSFNMKGFRWVLAMVFAIEEINKNPLFLPNVTLSYILYDTCSVVVRRMIAVLSVLGPEMASEHRECGISSWVLILPNLILIDPRSVHSLLISTFNICHFTLGQVDFMGTCKCYSNKNDFPSHFRTVPSDVHQSSALARLVKHFDWTYIGTLEVDDDYGYNGVMQFVTEAEKYGICIAFRETIPVTQNSLIYQQIVSKTKSQVVLLYINYMELIPLAQELVKINMTQKTWIATDGWVDSTELTKPPFTCLFEGTIGTALRRGIIPGLKEFLLQLRPQTIPLDELVLEFWETTFNCTWRGSAVDKLACTGREQVNEVSAEFADVSQLRLTYTVYMAVYNVAHALQALQACVPTQGPFGNRSCAKIDDFQPWQLVYYLRNVHFVTNLGDVMTFDEYGDPPAVYEVINWQPDITGALGFKVVGSYDARESDNNELHIDVDAIVWNNGGKQVPHSICNEPCSPGMRKVVLEGKPLCCYDCVLCNPEEYSNVTDCFHCLGDYWPNDKHDGCIPMLKEFLQLADPLALVLLAFALFGVLFILMTGILMYHGTNVRQAICEQDSTPRLRDPVQLSHALIVLTNPLLFRMAAVPFSYTMRLGVRSSQPNQEPKVSVLLHHTSQNCLSTNTIIVNIDIQHGVIIIYCNEETSIWAVCSMVYLAILIIVCFVLANKAKQYTLTIKEPKFITFSMLFLLLVLIAFIPAYNSTRGKFTVVTQIFALVASSYGIFGCLFLPKCYMIFKSKRKN